MDISTLRRHIAVTLAIPGVLVACSGLWFGGEGWSQTIPFYARAVILAGDVLFLAGPSEICDLTAARPGGTVQFRAVSAADGSTLAERTLRAAPVYDSFAAAQGRLYFTTVDDRVVCYGAP